MFIETIAAVEITMSSVKIQAVIFKAKFGVNQHDEVLRKQQSLGLGLKKIFSDECIIEEYFALNYRTDLTFKEYKLVVEIEEKGHTDRDPHYKTKRQKDLEKLGYYFIRNNPYNKGFNAYEKFGKVSSYIAKSIKKQNKELTEKTLIGDRSEGLLELEFKSNHSIKSNCLKWIIKKILPAL